MAASADQKTVFEQRKEQLLALLAKNPGMSHSALSTLSGLPNTTVRRIRQSLGVVRSAATAEPAPAPGVRTSETGDSCEVVRENPCTLEDLLKACKVDQTVWRVARWVANKWEVGTRCDDGTVLRTPLYQVKAFLERIPGVDDANAIRDAIEWIRAHPICRKKQAVFVTKKPGVEDPHLLEISVPDLHLGRLVWPDETGQDYNTAIAESLFMQAIENLWARASVFPVEQILLPCGNDFLNVDTAAQTTTAGTPQQEDGRWQRSFRRAVALMQRGIEFLRGRARDGIVVPMIPGNHDSQRNFYLGAVLEALYARTPDVRIDNSPNPRKYFRYGTNLLGFTHGHGEKHDKLPLIMAGERPDDWAATRHHEWHLGHLHHSRETRYHAGQEFGPVRVRILPSLVATDSWHHTQGYVGAQRAAEAYLWSQRHGYAGHLSWGVRAEADAS